MSLRLPARLALLSMLVVAVAVTAALYVAWHTTGVRLAAEIDSDLATQVREWDRLAAPRPPADAAALAGLARSWVREQQDHPARQLQAVVIDPNGHDGSAGSGPAPVVIGNGPWVRVARGTDVAALLGVGGPRDVVLGDGASYRVLTRAVTAAATGPTATAGVAASPVVAASPGRLGVVVVADSIETIAAARGALARDFLLIGALAMALAALLVGGGSALITRRLRRVGQAAAAAGAGDLGVRAGPVGGAPEVRDLARVLDESLDRIEATMRAQRAFIADASHELRTPLAVIRAQAELIGAEGDPRRRAQDVADLLRQTDATRRLVEDLLTIAAGDAAPTGLVQVQELDLVDHVADLRRDLPLLGRRRFVVETVPGTLLADPGRLDQIVRNLVANAVAHTAPNGLVEVRFEVGAEPGHLRIVVRDDGLGMSPEVLATAFERFTRGRQRAARTATSGAEPASTPSEQRPTEQRPSEQRPTEQRPTEQRPTEQRPTEQRPTEQRPTEQRPTEQRPTEQRPTEQPTGYRSGGAGLGLPLVRTLARAHGGTVSLESEPGIGTTAVVDLPGYRHL